MLRTRRGLPLATMAYESQGMKDRLYAPTQTLFHIPYATRHALIASSIICPI